MARSPDPVPHHVNTVLVLCEDAAEYGPLLQPLTDQGVTIDYAVSADAALQQPNHHTVLLATPKLAAAVIDHLPGVQWVQSIWAGITPLLKTKRQDFLVTGVKGVFGAQMAEYTLGHILAHELKLAERREQQARRSWWDQSSGRLHGRTLGVMGTGSIGAQIARTAQCLGLKVIGYSRSGAAGEDFAQVFPAGELNVFLHQADYVVAVLPDTPATTGLMNAASFSAMQPGALFINVGRGNLVDELALEQALRQQQLAGAVLDVFREEPLSPDSPLWTTPGLVITGHVAARSWPQDIVGIFLDNFRRYQHKQELNNVVDRGRGY
jgi:phosphoglycerate dehydrogenase-like enzyme